MIHALNLGLLNIDVNQQKSKTKHKFVFTGYARTINDDWFWHLNAVETFLIITLGSVKELTFWTRYSHKKLICWLLKL